MENIIKRKNEIIKANSVLRLDEEDFKNFEDFVHYEKLEVLGPENITVNLNYDKKEVIKKVIFYLESNVDIKLYYIEKILIGVRSFFDDEIEIIFSSNLNHSLDKITVDLFMYK